LKSRRFKTFFRQAVERLKSLPGVEDAAAALPTPFTGSMTGKPELISRRAGLRHCFRPADNGSSA
jgi:hypothetical protein